MVIRTPYGGGIRGGLYHSQSRRGVLLPHARAQGRRCPRRRTTRRASCSPRSRDPDPVLFLEPKALYRSVKGEVPEGSYTVELSTLRTVRAGQGRDGLLLRRDGAGRAKAAEQAAETGHRARASIDLRTLLPLDEEGVLEHAKRTGRVVVLHEAPRFCGFGAEISALIAEHAIEYMEAPDRARHRLRHALPEHARAPLPARRSAACSTRSSTSRTTRPQRSPGPWHSSSSCPTSARAIAEGEIVKWLVKAGDAVAEHQPVVEVMTDKATVEIPAPPQAGRITELRVEGAGRGRCSFELESRDGAAAKRAPRAHRAAAVRAPAPASAPGAPRPVAAAAPRGEAWRGSAPGSSGCGRPRLASERRRRDSPSSSPTSARASPRARSSSGWCKEGDTRQPSTSPIVEVMTDKATVEIPRARRGRDPDARRQGGRGRADRHGALRARRRRRRRQPAPAARRHATRRRRGRAAAAAPAHDRARASRQRPGARRPERAPRRARARRRSRRGPGLAAAAAIVRRADVEAFATRARRARALREPCARAAPTPAAARRPLRRRARRLRAIASRRRSARRARRSAACARKIAEAMARSKTTAAHFTVVEELDVTELVKLRGDGQEARRGAGHQGHLHALHHEGDRARRSRASRAERRLDEKRRRRLVHFALREPRHRDRTRRTA